MNRFLLMLSVVVLCISAVCAEPDAGSADVASRRGDVIRFGLDSEIIEMIDAMEGEKDTEPDENLIKGLTDLFFHTRSVGIRNRIIRYYTATKNKSLTDFALTVLDDPYDVEKSTVQAVFDYVRAVKLLEASPRLVALLDSGNEEFQNACIDALGDTGDDKAAHFLADYLNTADLELPAKQALVRSLGKLQSLETWQQLCDLAQDTDENTFMRMYAAEAIGAMEKTESVPILKKLFEDSDPNLRVYVLKGLAHYDTPDVYDVIIEAFRDSQYKVRMEAVSCAKEMKIADAVPYLLYRAKNDPEKNVKLACFDALAEFDTSDVFDFFKEVFTGKSSAEVYRLRSASLMIKKNFDTAYEYIYPDLSEKLKSKNSRDVSYCHALLKMLVPVSSGKLHELCLFLVSSHDITLQNFGIDIYARNKGGVYDDIIPYIKTFADNEKAPALAKKASRALGTAESSEISGSTPGVTTTE